MLSFLPKKKLFVQSSTHNLFSFAFFQHGFLLNVPTFAEGLDELCLTELKFFYLNLMRFEYAVPFFVLFLLGLAVFVSFEIVSENEI